EIEQLIKNRRLVSHDSEAPCLSCFVVKHNMQEFFRVVYDFKCLPDTSDLNCKEHRHGIKPDLKPKKRLRSSSVGTFFGKSDIGFVQQRCKKVSNRFWC
ncbi:MAG: hypothetical protein V3V05_00715, partial [Pontiella sp.]